MMKTLHRWIWLIALSALLLSPGRSAAHALGAECTLHPDKVVVEAYYSDDTAARDAAVEVQDSQKKIVATGKTDAKGIWSFSRPAAGRYTVVVDAGNGHRTQLKITVPPLAGAGNAEAPADAVRISTGQSRAEFTSFPWAKAAIGLGTIVILAFAWWASRTVRRGETTGP
jgi:hypothetical protein